MRRDDGLIRCDAAVLNRLELPDLTGARCAETDPEVFFPEKGRTSDDAKRICGACEVRLTCLDYALSDWTLTGTWGGATEAERRVLRRHRRAT